MLIAEVQAEVRGRRSKIEARIGTIGARTIPHPPATGPTVIRHRAAQLQRRDCAATLGNWPLQDLPKGNFTIYGASARNSAKGQAALQLKLVQGLTFVGALNGETAKSTSNLTGTATQEYS